MISRMMGSHTEWTKDRMMPQKWRGGEGERAGRGRERVKEREGGRDREGGRKRREGEKVVKCRTLLYMGKPKSA